MALPGVNDPGFQAAQAAGSFNGTAQAEQGQPVFPTRERPVQGLDVSGVASIAGDIAAFAGKQQAAAAKLHTETVEGQYAQTDQQIRFAAGNGAAPEALARAATGYVKDTGINPTPQQTQVMNQYNDAVTAIKNAADQNPRFGMEQALLIARNRALQTNPELSKELLQISGTLNTVSSGFDSAAFAASEAQTKRQQQAMDTITSTVTAHGVDTSQMNDSQVRAYYQNNIQPAQALIQSTKDTYDVVKGQTDLTAMQRNNQRDQLLQGAQGALSSTVTMGVRQAMTQAKAQGGTPEQIAQAGTDAVQQFSAKLRQNYDITNQADFDSKFGWITGPLTKDIQDFATSKLDSEGLTNQLNLRMASTEQRILDRVPGAATAAVLNSKFGTILTPYLNQNADASKLIGNIILTAAQDSQKQPNTPIDVTGGKGLSYPQQAITADAGKAGQLVKQLYENPAAGTPEGKSASVKVAMSYLTDPSAIRTFEPMKAIAGAVADPRWLELSKGVQVPQAALDNVNQYLDSINARSAQLVKGEGDNLLPTVDDKGYLHLDVKNPSKQAGKLKLLESDLNEGVRMYAHLQGSTDYRSVLAQLIAEQQAQSGAK